MVTTKIIGFFALILAFFTAAPDVGAFFWDDWFGKVKEVITGEQLPVTIDSTISLAPLGDINKNGQIDAGDTVTFSYTLTNTSNTEYAFVTLVTNIDRNQLHFIHNVRGSASLTDRGGTINIPNIRLGPLQTVSIQFDSRVNFNPSKDVVLATQPELLNSDRTVIGRSQRKEKKALKWLGELPSLILRKKP